MQLSYGERYDEVKDKQTRLKLIIKLVETYGNTVRFLREYVERSDGSKSGLLIVL